MRLTQIGDDFVKYLLRTDRAKIVPLDYRVVNNEYPLLAEFINKLALAQVREFAQHGMPPIMSPPVFGTYLAASMKHILTVLDCEDDWTAQQLLNY